MVSWVANYLLQQEASKFLKSVFLVVENVFLWFLEMRGEGLIASQGFDRILNNGLGN